MNILQSLLSTSRGKLGISLLALVALIFSGCGSGGGGGGGTTPPPAAPTLTSIAISPTATIIKKAATTSYTATGTYSDGSTANITSTVTWTSSLTGVATISAAGVATGVAAGTTTITASYGGMTSPDAALTVITLSSIAITPATATVNEGATTSFTATGTYSNGTTENITNQVTWGTGTPSTATIGTATGVATGVLAGSTTVTAALSPINAPNASLTVIASAVTLTGIAITPTTASAAKGVPVTFTATGTFSSGPAGDVSGSVTWASSNTAVATINSSGIATTLATGTTDITATSGGITSTPVPVTLTVTAPELATLAVTPSPASVTMGIPKQLNISGTMTDGTAATAANWGTLTWTGTGGIVSINGTTGLATGVTPGGPVNIYATSGAINSNTVALTVVLNQMGGAMQGLPLALLNPVAVTTLAGTGSATPANTDGAGASATFSSPGSVTTDGTNLYVADTVNHTIRKIVIASGTVSTLAGAAGFPAATNGTGTSAKFYFPEGIATDGTNLYVADTSNNLIRKIVIATAAVTTLAGSGSFGSTDGTGTAATFSNPRGITVDGSGNLYVADTASNKIRKIVIATQVVTTHSTLLNAPRGLTTDGTYLYVANTGDSTIRKIPIGGGTLTSLTGTFNAPRGITTDGTNLYVANTDGNTIIKIVIASGAVSTLAGSGAASSVDGSGITTASFNLPHGITTDGTSLFVVDNGGHKIRKID